VLLPGDCTKEEKKKSHHPNADRRRTTAKVGGYIQVCERQVMISHRTHDDEQHTVGEEEVWS
jgi:hypothetical protein